MGSLPYMLSSFSFYIWMTSYLVKHPSFLHLMSKWTLSPEHFGPIYEHAFEQHTHTHTFCSILEGWTVTSASVWVNPCVCRASGLYCTAVRESLLIRNRLADRQAVLLHKGCSKKKASSTGQRTDGSRRKRASGGGGSSLPVPLLNRCTVYLFKNKSDLGQAFPGSPLWSPAAFNFVLFSIPPTGPELMANPV